MAREIICGIYKITNLVNGKIYIGQSKDIYKRWKEHRYNIANKKYESCILYKAIKKYGIDNFEFSVVESCKIEDLNIREEYYIRKYKTYVGFKDCNGYNMTLGGEGNNGGYKSPEWRKKVSEANKGRKSWNKGKKYSLPHMKGRFSGKNNPFYGKHHTKEAKKKLRDSHLGKPSQIGQKVFCDGKIFNSISECAKYYDIPVETMVDWIRGKRGCPEKFIELGLDTFPKSNCVKPKKSRKGKNNPSARKVVCITTGVVYDTIKEASNDTGANYRNIPLVCKGKRETTGMLKDGTKLQWMYYDEYLKGGENGCEKK